MSKQLSAEEVINKIVEHTGKTYEEVKDLVAKTRESLNNFVNEQGAAYLLANNLEVPLTDNSVKPSNIIQIKDIVEGMGPISLFARIGKIYRTKHFMRKDNTPGQLKRIELIDKTGKIYATLWNEKTKLVDELNLSPGRIVRIANAEPRMGLNNEIELNLGSRSTIDTNTIGIDETDFPEVEKEVVLPINQIPDESLNVSIVGKIVERQGIREFERQDGSKGRVTSLKIMDTTGRIRVSFWDDDVSLALSFDEGQVVKLTSLKSHINKNGFKELTFQSFSRIFPYSSNELEALPIEAINEAPFLSVNQIDETVRNVSIIGKVVGINKRISFMSEKGDGSLQSIIIADPTGMINVNFWNESIEKLTEIHPDDIVKITNAYTRYSDYSQKIELNFGKFSEIEINPPETLNDDITVPYVKFEDIADRMPSVFIKLKIMSEGEERTTIRKVDNTEAKVINFQVIDENGEFGRLAAWDDDIELLKDLGVDDTIEIRMGRAKRDDYGVSITIGRNSKVLKINNFDDSNTLLQTADKLPQSNFYEKVELDKIQQGMNVYIEGLIVKIFQKVVFYDSCLMCSRKVTNETGEWICREHGSIEKPRKRMIVTVTLDDNSSITMKAKFFGETAEQLFGMTSDEAYEINERIGEENAVVEQVKDKILLKPLWIKGKAKEDQISDEIVLDISKFGWLDPHKKTDEILSRYQGL